MQSHDRFDVVADIRYGARLLVRQRGFAAVAILTTVLAIGVTATLFSMFDVVLLGGATIFMFVISKLEAVALRDRASSIVFSAVLVAPNAVRFLRQRPRKLGIAALVQG